MTSRLRTHFGSNLIGYVALFVALTLGTAYAADKIGSKDIKRGAVKSKHVRNSTLLAEDFAPGQLQPGQPGAPGQNGQPGAPGAPGGGAGPVTDGVLRESLPEGSLLQLVETIEGVQLHMGCNPDATLTVIGSAAGDHGTLTFSAGPTAVDGFTEFTDTSGFQIASLIGDRTFAAGTITMRRSGGTIVLIDFELVERTNGFGTTDDCFLSGTSRVAT